VRLWRAGGDDDDATVSDFDPDIGHRLSPRMAAAAVARNQSAIVAAERRGARGVWVDAQPAVVGGLLPADVARFLADPEARAAMLAAVAGMRGGVQEGEEGGEEEGEEGEGGPGECRVG
jgi:hypothetical protein